MDFKKVTIYFVIPFVTSITLIAFYFSGIELLQNLVSPRMRGISPTTSREFGILENIQNLILLSMLAILIYAFPKKKTVLEKVGIALLIPFTIFVILEEVDYGLHYYEYLNDVRWADSAEVRNWHNQGDRTDKTKQVVDLSMVVLFGILPFALARNRRPLVRFFTPDRYSVLTLIAGLLVRTTAHWLKDNGYGNPGTIHSNLSEFRETITYYIFLLYIFQLALRRHLASPPASD